MRNRTLLVDPAPPKKTEYDRPSKSQLKRDSTALQDLGREIGELPRDRIKELDLPEKLYEALLHYQTVTAHEGKRRQLQYLGKLMRDVDPDPLRAALDRFKGASKDEVHDMHLGERWRERLLAEDTAATLAEFKAEYPDTDLQQLRALLRATRKERETQKPPRDYRKLYQMIREQIDAARKARNAVAATEAAAAPAEENPS